MNGADACHSVTNYECYKGLYSSFNTGNMHEIAYSLNRQFGSEQWCLYTGHHLLCFADNHDVSRISTQLTDKNQLQALYGLLFAMPGVPSVYYGSEWGLEGDKHNGDPSLRPAIERPEWNPLTDWIAQLAQLHRENSALCYGGYHNVQIQPKQLVFLRWNEEQRILVAVNADSQPAHVSFDVGTGSGVNLMTGERTQFGGGAELPAYSCTYWKLD